MTGPCACTSLFNVISVTCGKPVQGGDNSGRNVATSKNRQVLKALNHLVEKLPRSWIEPVHIFKPHQHRAPYGKPLKLCEKSTEE